MSIKLRDLVLLDDGYGEELKAFFRENGMAGTEYLDMTVDEFLKFCMGKIERWDQQVMEAVQKREHGRNSHI